MCDVIFNLHTENHGLSSLRKKLYCLWNFKAEMGHTYPACLASVDHVAGSWVCRSYRACARCGCHGCRPRRDERSCVIGGRRRRKRGNARRRSSIWRSLCPSCPSAPSSRSGSRRSRALVLRLRKKTRIGVKFLNFPKHFLFVLFFDFIRNMQYKLYHVYQSSRLTPSKLVM